MTDREKVIKGLETIRINIRQMNHGLLADFCDDALALLKEQEAKWVEEKQDEHCRLIKCSNCGLTFIVGNNIPYDEWIEDRNYCRRCGARMKGDQRNEQ